MTKHRTGTRKEWLAARLELLEAEKELTRPAWLFEPKYDGYRGLRYVTRNGCHFRSKRGNILKRFEELCCWVREELPVKEATARWLPSIARAGRTSAISLRAVDLHYAAFDALWIEGKDLRPLLLTRRKQLLTRLIPATTTVLSQVFTIEERGRDLFAAAERLDLEGIVAKQKAEPTMPGDLVQDQEPGVHPDGGSGRAVPRSAVKGGLGHRRTLVKTFMYASHGEGRESDAVLNQLSPDGEGPQGSEGSEPQAA